MSKPKESKCEGCGEPADHADRGPRGYVSGPCCGGFRCCASCEPADFARGWLRVEVEPMPAVTNTEGTPP